MESDKSRGSREDETSKKIFAWMEDKELNSLGEKFPG